MGKKGTKISIAPARLAGVPLLTGGREEGGGGLVNAAVSPLPVSTVVIYCCTVILVDAATIPVYRSRKPVQN